MGHLIKLEWLKMKGYTAFRVLAFLFILIFPLILRGRSGVDTNSGTIQTFLDSFYSFPSVYNVLGYAGSWLTFFFLGFMALLSVTNDYTNKTLRQNILTGLTRKEFILSKLLFVGAICSVVTLYFILVGGFLGFMNTPKIYLSDFTDSLLVFGKFFLMCFGYSVFGMLIGLLVKKTGLALFLYMAYGMFIEPIFRYVIHSKISTGSSIHLYPLNSIEELIPIPEMAKRLEAITDSWEGVELFISSPLAIMAASFYIGLFIFLLFFIINKRDL